jgi:hypothetical protein
MVGSFLLLAAALASQATPEARGSSANNFRPTSTVTAHAIARITIISGVSFGPDHLSVPADAARRSALLTDYDGQVRAAELLEFQ